MEADERRWQQLVEEGGLADVTRLIIAEHPGEGDSVEDLADIWGDMSVLQIYEAIVAEKAGRPEAARWAHLWDQMRAGANAPDHLVPLPVESRDFVTCNCL